MTDNDITHEIIGVAIEAHPLLGPIHEAVILTHIRLSGRRLGLLINFNVTVLKDGIKPIYHLAPPDGEKDLTQRTQREESTKDTGKRKRNA